MVYLGFLSLVSRKHEFDADAFAAKLVGKSQMISSLLIESPELSEVEKLNFRLRMMRLNLLSLTIRYFVGMECAIRILGLVLNSPPWHEFPSMTIRYWSIVLYAIGVLIVVNAERYKLTTKESLEFTLIDNVLGSTHPSTHRRIEALFKL
jgi:Zn-dependent protease with chaperone function